MSIINSCIKCQAICFGILCFHSTFSGNYVWLPALIHCDNSQLQKDEKLKLKPWCALAYYFDFYNLLA